MDDYSNILDVFTTNILITEYITIITTNQKISLILTHFCNDKNNVNNRPNVK